jgi:hypothetical protein
MDRNKRILHAVDMHGTYYVDWLWLWLTNVLCIWFTKTACLEEQDMLYTLWEKGCGNWSHDYKRVCKEISSMFWRPVCWLWQQKLKDPKMLAEKRCYMLRWGGRWLSFDVLDFEWSWNAHPFLFELLAQYMKCVSIAQLVQVLHPKKCEWWAPCLRASNKTQRICAGSSRIILDCQYLLPILDAHASWL